MKLQQTHVEYGEVFGRFDEISKVLWGFRINDIWIYKEFHEQREKTKNWKEMNLD